MRPVRADVGAVRFLTPDEQRLLAAVSEPERRLIRELFELLDARLVTTTKEGNRV